MVGYWGVSKRLPTFLALISLAKADYYIDDQNYTSLVYSENPEGGVEWGALQKGGETLYIALANGTVMTVDASQCFNYTYTYAGCTIADSCQVQIPFSGSGITIYVLQAGERGVNASLTIDGGAPEYSALSAPLGPNFYEPNVPLFSVQGMTTGNHTAAMTVLDWDNISSWMMFDYALINQTVVSNISTMTTTSLVSSTTTPTTLISTLMATSSPSKSAAHVGAIVGGVVGGLAALIILLLALSYLCWRRREAQRWNTIQDVKSGMGSFVSTNSVHHSWPQQYMDATEYSTTESTVTSTVSAPVLPLHSTSPGSFRRDKSFLAVSNPTISRIADLDVTSSSQADSSSTYTLTSETPPPRVQQTHPTLTDDQADFVNSLYANNIPPGVIARVIKRMMAGKRQPAADGYDPLPQPTYYHGTGGK